jgi:peptidoglycan-N-acetylglucosamine deacetylase
MLHDTGYGYDSSFGDEDVPYRMAVASGRDDAIIELPWSWTLDDAPYYKHPGVIRRPDEVIDLWIDEFDAALEMTGFFMIVCHPRFSGRPARIRALERLIEHIRSHDGSRFARCRDIADAVAESRLTPSYPAPEQR